MAVDDEGELTPTEVDEDQQLELALGQASARLRVATGERAGQEVRRRTLNERRREPKPRSRKAMQARVLGFDLEANVRIEAHDRWLLERVARYLLRPPLAMERLVLRDDGLYEYVKGRLSAIYSRCPRAGTSRVGTSTRRQRRCQSVRQQARKILVHGLPHLDASRVDRVRGFRKSHRIRLQPPDPDSLNAQQAAKYLGISRNAITTLIKMGAVNNHQVTDFAPWRLSRAQLDSEPVRRLLRGLAATGRIPRLGGCPDEQMTIFPMNSTKVEERAWC